MDVKNNMTLNVSGGQINFVKDNGTITATQNNGISNNELDTIITEIKNNLSNLEKGEAEKIIDAVDLTMEELTKQQPKISRLKNCITLIAPLVTIANGIPNLSNNLQRLQEFIMHFIKAL